MTSKGFINLDDLPEEVRLAMYEELAKVYGKRKRQSNQVSKEAKMLVVASILSDMRGLNIAQQRSVLNFTTRILENAQKRYWRDGDNNNGKKHSHCQQ